MKGLKIALLILGALMIVAGIICIVHPDVTFMTLAWMTGILMLVEGITSIVAWAKGHKVGESNGVFLLGAILSVFFGIALIFSNVTQATYEMFLTVMASGWLLVLGIIRIISGMRLRKAYVFSDHMVGRRWLLMIVIGAVMAIAGVVGFVMPGILATAMSVFLGIYAALIGANVMAVGFAIELDKEV